MIHRCCLALLAILLGSAGAARGQAILADIHEGTNVAIALSPDGRTLATDHLGRIWTLPSSGGAATPLTPPDALARLPRFSPDGTQLVYQQHVDGQWDVWQLSLADGSARALTGPPHDEVEPDFDPNGRRIVLVSNRTGQRALWELELDSGRFARLSFEPGAAAFPAVSEHGVIAYVAELGAASILRLLTADGFTTDVHRSPHRLGAPSWRPGGGALVFSEHERLRRSDLRLLLLSQAPLVKTLTHDEDVFPGRVAWLDAGEVLYAADGRLWRRGLALTTRYPVPMFAATSVPPVAAPMQTAALAPAAPDMAAQASAAPQVAPGGAQFVQAALGDLWLGDARNRWRRLTDDPYVDFDPVFRDDEEIVFASDRGGNVDLWRLSLPRELLTQLTHAQTKDYAPAISPDGRAVAFLATAGLGPWASHSLQLLSLEAPDRVRVLADDLLAPQRPAWAEDGSAVLLVAATASATPVQAPLRFDLTPAFGPGRPRAAPSRGRPVDPATDLRFAPQLSTGRYVIQVGRLFDGIGNQYRRHMDVHVEGNRIAAVVGRGLLPLPEQVIDARELTLLPGFVDLHTHPTELAGERLGRTWLYYGVTTIQDVGDDTAAAIARAQAWTAGRTLGPRVFRAHAGDTPTHLTGPGPQRVPSVGLAAGDLLAEQAAARGGSGPEGPASLGTAAGVGPPSLPGLSPLGRAYQDVVSLLVHSGQVFIPTLASLGDAWHRHLPTRELQSYQLLFTPLEHPPLPGGGVDAMSAMATLAAAVLSAGGRVGLGSDAPAVPFGLGLHAELALLSEFGMANDQILRVATTGGALALGLDAELGSIETGKLADFILLSGDPLTRITDSLSIVAVVRDGHWIERAALLKPGQGHARAR